MRKHASISSVCEVNPRIPKGLRKQLDLDVAFLRMAAVQESGMISGVEERRLGDVLKGYTYFEEGDILIAKITPCMENGKAAQAVGLPHRIGFGSTEFHVLRPGSDVDGRYLFHMVWNPIFRDAAKRRMTGSAGQKRVPTSFFEQFKIPLPPLPEQRRIAAILDKADAIRRKRQQTLDLADQFLRSAFLDMFGDPVTNPKGWLMKKLDDVSLFITDGEHATPRRTEHGVKLLSARNVKNGFVDLNEKVDHIPIDEYERIRRRCDPVRGDLLISCSGSIGRVAVLELDEPVAFVRSVAIIRLDPSAVLPRFAEYWLRTPFTQAHMRRGSKASSQANLFQGEIAKLPVLVPPLDKQEQFSNLAERWSVQVERRSWLSKTGKRLCDSLTQRAFRGEL